MPMERHGQAAQGADERKRATSQHETYSESFVRASWAHEEPLVRLLHMVIRVAVRALAILMVGVICLGVFDVIHVLYVQIQDPSGGLLNLTDIVNTFGRFMGVLIAIEIFHNITSYLRTDVIQVRIVLATAVMAAARKIIVLDAKTESAAHVAATAAVVLAIGVVYWLVTRTARAPSPGGERSDDPSLSIAKPPDVDHRDSEAPAVTVVAVEASMDAPATAH